MAAARAVSIESGHLWTNENGTGERGENATSDLFLPNILVLYLSRETQTANEMQQILWNHHPFFLKLTLIERLRSINLIKRQIF